MTKVALYFRENILQFDLMKKVLFKNGEKVLLRPISYRLLELLLFYDKGAVKDDIKEYLWKSKFIDRGLVNVTFCHLRNELKKAGLEGLLAQSARNDPVYTLYREACKPVDHEGNPRW